MTELIIKPELIEKIKTFINERLNKPVKEGVDLTAIVRKLKERRAKRGK